MMSLQMSLELCDYQIFALLHNCLCSSGQKMRLFKYPLLPTLSF